MAFAKTAEFNAAQVRLAEFARAMSHPARIAIVMYLQERDDVPCGEIVKALPLSQATVSQHLRALREAQLIAAHTEGTQVRYSLRGENILNFCRSFQAAMGNAPLEYFETVTEIGD